jgi:hypothetical protein
MRDEHGAVQVEAADTLPEIQHNPILEAFATHYEQERELFTLTASRQPEEPA